MSAFEAMQLPTAATVFCYGVWVVAREQQKTNGLEWISRSFAESGELGLFLMSPSSQRMGREMC